MAYRDSDQRSLLQGTGQHKAFVVVGVLADEVDPPRRESQHFRFAAETLTETRDDTGLERGRCHAAATARNRAAASSGVRSRCGSASIS